MKKGIFHLLRALGLVLTLLPSILVFEGSIALDTHKTLMLLGCLAWFGAISFGKRSDADD